MTSVAAGVAAALAPRLPSEDVIITGIDLARAGGDFTVITGRVIGSHKVVGQMIYNSCLDDFVWWTGDEWVDWAGKSSGKS